MFFHNLTPGDTIDNARLIELFHCSEQGGMRRALRTNSLVLVSNHIKSTYDDRWAGEIIHYTGMGQKGDQSLDFMQNKTLTLSQTNGVLVFLFEVFREKEYTYRGQVELIDSPYMENQLDSDRKLRTVWIFPLKLKGEAARFHPSKEILDEVKASQDKHARRMSSDELRERALHSRKSSTMMQNTVNVFYRDSYVSEYAKRRADGHCQLCGHAAPFHNKRGEPFLETHHVKWLARGGEDTVENTVALCPNCHRKMHVLDLQTEVLKLLQVAGGWLV